jgi:hypothetical protein
MPEGRGFTPISGKKTLTETSPELLALMEQTSLHTSLRHPN